MEQIKKLIIKAFEEIDGCCEYCRYAFEDPSLSGLYRDIASSKLDGASRIMSAVMDRVSSQDENDQAAHLRSVMDILSCVIDERMRTAKDMLSSIK